MSSVISQAQMNRDGNRNQVQTIDSLISGAVSTIDNLISRVDGVAAVNAEGGI